MRRKWLVAGLIVGALMFLTAPAGASVHVRQDSMSDVTAAAAKLNSAVASYLNLGNRQPPTDSAGWKSFFDRGDRLVANLKARFQKWSDALDAAIRDGHRAPKRLLRYRSALKIWIADQVQQAHLSRGCYVTSNGFASPTDAGSCYAQMVTANGTRWNDDAAQLNALLPTH